MMWENGLKNRFPGVLYFVFSEDADSIECGIDVFSKLPSDGEVADQRTEIWKEQFWAIYCLKWGSKWNMFFLYNYFCQPHGIMAKCNSENLNGVLCGSLTLLRLMRDYHYHIMLQYVQN